MGGREDGWWGSVAAATPTVAPALDNNVARDEHWRRFDNSVNAVSFGFVATVVLISMFLVMAIFERFLRPRSNSLRRLDAEAQLVLRGKLDSPSPNMTVYGRGVSVLMPGEEVPTFIAHPAPAPCPPERASWPLHEQNHCLIDDTQPRL